MLMQNAAADCHCFRLFWLVVVLTAVVTFTVQVVQRTHDYLQYNSNVNVEIQYAEQVLFPAVTICNLNTFSLSASVNMGVYKFLDDVFSARDMSEINFAGYDLGIMNLTELYVRSAPQKGDLIVRCIWKGKLCNISAEFEMVLTDIGVCYAFNCGFQRKLVNEAGSRHGLRLILNLEQYEHMRGPHDDAGVKILLHDQNEVALVEDMGFSIGPGTHATVGVKQTLVENLGKPWGQCDDTVPSMSHCRADCKTEYVVRRCGCTAEYMNSTKAPVCNVTFGFHCVHRELAAMQEKGIVCNCSAPCKRKLYEPVLSYSQLSKFNIKKLMLPEREQADRVFEKFMKARETSQVVLSDIRNADVKHMMRYANISARFTSLLNTSRLIISDEKYRVTQFGVGSPLSSLIATSRWATVHLDEVKRTRYQDIYERFVKSSEQYGKEIDLFYKDLYGKFFPTFRNGDVFGPWIDCLENGTSIHVDLDGNDGPCSIYNPKSTLSKIESAAESLVEADKTEIFGLISNINHTYMNAISSIFQNSSYDFETRQDHLDCLKKIEIFNQTYVAAVYNITTELTKYLSESSLSAKYERAQNIHRIRESLTGTSSVSQICKWFDYSNVNTDAIKIKLNPIEQQSRTMNTLTAHINHARKSIEFLLSKTSHLVDHVMAYLDGNVTKDTLGDLFTHSDTIDNLNEIRIIHKEMILASSSLEQLVVLLNGLIHGFSIAVFDFRLPVADDTVINEIPIIQFVRNNVTSQHIQTLLMRMSENRPRYFRMILSETFKTFAKYTDDTVKHLVESGKDYIERMEQLLSRLRKYKEGNKLDEAFFLENFMQVDIFYKELSYQKIEQKEAFVFVSLLSEVGGFLGLLLGASVLTLCELCDFLAMKMLAKCAVRIAPR